MTTSHANSDAAGQGRFIGCAAPEAIWREMRSICARAWQKNLLAGFNGNISLRRGPYIYVTKSGAAKGDLAPGDIVKMDLEGQVLAGIGPSSETPMHLAVYAVTNARAIVHTHPRHLLALSLLVTEEHFLDLPLFECATLRKRLAFARELPPGGLELAGAVAEAARDCEAVWMWGHGLVCRADKLSTALALGDELEHLAAIQILSKGIQS